MTKLEYVDYWKISAEKSWRVAHDLFDKADFVESLFFAHLTLEKIIKAHWVRDNKNDFHRGRIICDIYQRK
jgi:HEPN domain-containing protein